MAKLSETNAAAEVRIAPTSPSAPCDALPHARRASLRKSPLPPCPLLHFLRIKPDVFVDPPAGDATIRRTLPTSITMLALIWPPVGRPNPTRTRQRS